MYATWAAEDTAAAPHKKLEAELRTGQKTWASGQEGTACSWISLIPLVLLLLEMLTRSEAVHHASQREVQTAMLWPLLAAMAAA